MTHYREIDKAISALERQIDQLRQQSSDLAAEMTHRAGHGAADLRAKAHGMSRDLFDGAYSGWHGADRSARRGARQVVEFARENPATISSAGLAAAGLIGLGLWWLLRSEH